MKGLLFFLLFVSTAALGQLKCCFTAAPLYPNHTITDSTVSWTQTSTGGYGTMRADSAYTGTVVVPYGYAYPTVITKSMDKANTLISTTVGTGTSVTVPFLGMDSVNTYELHVTSHDVLSYGISTTSVNLASAAFPISFTTSVGLTNFYIGKTVKIGSLANWSNYVEGIVSGYNSGTGSLTLSSGTIGGTGTHTDWVIRRPDLDWVLPGFGSCQPGRFSEAQANLVIDMATYGISSINGGDVDRSAATYKIFVKNSKSGSVAWAAFGWYGGVMTPVIFQFYNASITSSTGAVQIMKFSDCKNIVISGSTTANSRYGLAITRTAGNTENFYFEAFPSKNVIISGIHVDNGVYTQGGSGFVVMQVQNSATWNANTTSNDRVLMYNLLAENCGAENFYLNHTSDDASPPFIQGKYWFVYNCDAVNGKNEGMQTGGINHLEVFRNSWTGTGLGAVSGQMNIFVIRDGIKNGFYYMNSGQNAHDITQAFNNRTGGNVEMFANKWETTGGTGLQNSLFRLAQSALYTQIKYHSYNNTTIALTNDNEQYSLYNDPTYPPSTMTATEWYADANVFVSTVTTGAVSHNSYVTTNTLVNNKAYLTSNLATIKFKNTITKDYHIAFNSPLMNFARNSTINAAKVHHLAGYDNEGYAYNLSNPAAGCYAGVTSMFKY